MTHLHATFTTTLTASHFDRVISGLLLPYNQEGQTNLGRLKAAAHTLTLPTEPIYLNVEHEPTRRVGKSLRIEETPEGLRASFHVAKTRAGDDALVEVEEGLRACLSIEVDNPVTRNGQLLAGLVTGAALVARPAFPDARLAASLVEDLGDLDNLDQVANPDDEEDEETEGEDAEIVYTETVQTELVDTVDGTTVTTESTYTETIQEDHPMTAARVPATTAKKTALTAASTGKRELFRLLAGANQGDSKMLAALSNVTSTSMAGIGQPQYVGELWDGKAYERQFIPAFNHSDLESYKVTGWRWVTRPTVAAYAGGLANVHSSAIETEAVEIAAERIAGAHKIDRKYRDFSDEEFWAAYFAAMTESYARVSDTSVLADVVEGATKIKAGTVPTGVAKGLVYIIDGILAVLAETDTMPDTAFVAPGLYREILLTKDRDVLGYLDAALGFEDGTMRNFRMKPTAQIAEGKVLVTCKDAVTVHELGGSAPIRVDALDIAKGGIDEGLFGYYAVNIHDKGGLALVNETGE